MLGQALREKPALRFSECSVRGHIQRRLHYCPRAELSTFPEGWRPTRVGFSLSPGAYPVIFCPLPEQLTFPSGQAAYPCGIFPEG